MSTPCFLGCSSLSASACSHCGDTSSCEQHLPIHRPQHSCLPFRIGFDESKGRIVLATRMIKAGEVVLTDTPLVEGPGNRTAASCLNCLASWEAGRGQYCTACGWPICNLECQNGKWHSLECSVLERLDSKPDFTSDLCPEYSAIFALRICLLVSSAEHREQLDLLMDHAEEIQREQTFSATWGPALDLLQTLQGMLPYSGLRGIGIFCTNAVSMPHRNGRWLFPTFSFLSHSCISNCRFFLHPGSKVVVRAQEDIPLGGEITISYLESGVGYVLRRPYIENMWYFTCQCQLCTDPTEKGTFFSALICRGCGDFVLPQDCSKDADWACVKCKKCIDSRSVFTLTKALEHKVKECSSKEEVDTLLERMSLLLHPNHFLLLALKEKWIKFKPEDRNSLEKGLKLVSEVITLRKVIEPGITLNLGENLKLLNQFMLGLARVRLDGGEITQPEFMKIVLGAASNIKFAKRCFEDQN